MTNLDSSFARQDHFALFDLPRRHALDRDALERRYHDLQARVHPDKHAHLGDADRRLAMQWATQVNEAYQTLRDPLRRARYLLHLAGHDPQIESNTAMPADFLMRQMELREAVVDARAAAAVERLDGLQRALRKELAARYAALGATIDDAGDLAGAGEIVRQLMFEEKLLSEIDEALQAVEA